MVELLGYISVQADWTVDVKNALSGVEGKHSFWVSAYKQGFPSIHDTIEASKATAPDGATALIDLQTTESQEISAEYIDSHRLRLSSSKLGIAPVLHTTAQKTVTCSQVVRKTGVTSFDVSPYGGLLVAGGDEGVMDVYEINDAVHRVKLEGHFGDITSCRFFPSGQVILSGATDMRLKVWSASDGTNPVTLVGHTAAITDTAIVGKGKNVLSSSKDGTVRMWHCGTASVVHKFELSKLSVNQIDLVSIAADSTEPEEAESELGNNQFQTRDKVLVAACEDGRTVLIDLYTKQTIAEYSTTGGLPVRAVAYDAANSRVYSGLSDGTVEVWSFNSSENTLLHSFKRNDSSISFIRLVTYKASNSPCACVGTEDGQLFVVSLNGSSSKTIGNAEVVEELVGFDVDPISQIRVVLSSTSDASRQSIWATGSGNKALRF
ncbi:hypothetical protein LPJ56_002106 [Coemansia sp. RSA 2599]|nr:hypothetical protein LPJ75_001761 [Coemansia sp. RSA 2598]KAJ1826578.1 hypothetical protein LPJ56_002106 [Coemansia sp. RSA 2599]